MFVNWPPGSEPSHSFFYRKNSLTPNKRHGATRPNRTKGGPRAPKHSQAKRRQGSTSTREKERPRAGERGRGTHRGQSRRARTGTRASAAAHTGDTTKANKRQRGPPTHRPTLPTNAPTRQGGEKQNHPLQKGASYARVRRRHAALYGCCHVRDANHS